jgi:uncharacterized DUF497 family protein
MDIEYDPAKRVQTLQQRGLDMEDAPHVFAGLKVTVADDRKDYGEARWITFGFLHERMVVIVWTPRGNKTRIISMRKVNDREKEIFSGRMA